MRPAVCLMAAGFILSAVAAQDPPAVTFGTSVVLPGGLKGVIYRIPRKTTKLPDFEKLKPVGSIYTSALDVPEQDFRQGFPGVTKRTEWFAIDYSGRFWVDRPGVYTFALTSDDGACLYIDGQMVIDNDGLHPPVEKTGVVALTNGVHQIRVAYFQGPRLQVALVLKIAGKGEELRVFSTDEFKPPLHPETWPFEEKKK